MLYRWISLICVSTKWWSIIPVRKEHILLRSMLLLNQKEAKARVPQQEEKPSLLSGWVLLWSRLGALWRSFVPSSFISFAFPCNPNGCSCGLSEPGQVCLLVLTHITCEYRWETRLSQLSCVLIIPNWVLVYAFLSNKLCLRW